MNRSSPAARTSAVLPEPHAALAEDVLAAFAVDARLGLSDGEAEARLQRSGLNRLREVRARRAWRILAAQFKSVVVGLLVAGVLLSLGFGRLLEAGAIAIVLAINATIGFATELRAVRSVEALRRLGDARTNVRRGGRLLRVNAERLVPGDIVVLEAGDVIPADLRLLAGSKLQADESLLTGESMPVGKSPVAIAASAPLAERRNMLFRGAALTRGAGEAVVVGTGFDTELGRISRLVEEVRDEPTPLERRLDRLGRGLLVVTFGVAALVIATGIASERDAFLIAQTALALAVAAVPEGLPVIATLALARGVRRMAARNALVNRLAAVETLGATAVVIVDKTGTLTENRMTVVELALPSGSVEVRARETEAFVRGELRLFPATDRELSLALEAGVLCNDAALGDGDEPIGDPLELALLAAGRRANIERPALIEKFAEVRDVAFDPALKRMATIHRDGDAFRVAVKGAPEAVIRACARVADAAGERALDTTARADWLARNERMAERGLRVLGLAARRAASADEDPYADLTLLGWVGLLDPPRADVRDAITACRSAGIRVVMATGDQPATARNVALAVGLADDPRAPVVLGDELAADDAKALAAPILARMNPEQKLALITLYQASGAVVAMTGDGVNDAPALRKADIGVAMGERGSAVAREAADLVLRDDAFATIVAAVHQGRVIFGNIRAFVIYLVACNLSEILVVGIATALRAPLPLLPLQILFLNFVTDVFPALALGASEGPPDVMQHPPRDPREPLLAASHWRAALRGAAVITACVFAAIALATRLLGLAEREVGTVAFFTLALAQVFHVFDMRSPGAPVWRSEVTRNPWAWGAIATCGFLLAAAAALPGLARALELAPLNARAWQLVMAMSFAALIVNTGLRGAGGCGGASRPRAELLGQRNQPGGHERV